MTTIPRHYLRRTEYGKLWGLSPSTLLRWEKRGWVTPVYSDGGQRYYAAHVPPGRPARSVGSGQRARELRTGRQPNVSQRPPAGATAPLPRRTIALTQRTLAVLAHFGYSFDAVLRGTVPAHVLEHLR